MKNPIFILALVLSIGIHAQIHTHKSAIFIRVYNLQGQKIAKGKIFKVSDTIFGLIKNKKTSYHTYSQIGFVKTKHSEGNNVLMGATIGGASLAMLGILAGDGGGSYISGNSTSNAAIGLIGGSFLGSIIGVFTNIFKKSETIPINGDSLRFKEFLENYNLK